MRAEVIIILKAKTKGTEVPKKIRKQRDEESGDKNTEK